MKISWEKVACALLAGAFLLAGGALAKIYAIDISYNVWKAVTEQRMATWHVTAPTLSSNSASPASHVMLASQYSKGLTCEQRLDFSQKTMLRVYGQIKSGAYDPALKTLMIGLEDSGLTCREYKGGLECNPN